MLSLTKSPTPPQDDVVVGDAAVVAAAETMAPDAALKIAMIKMVVPNFSWDLTKHWKTRVKEAVENWSSNPLYLNGILAVETDAVKTGITAALAAR